MRRAPEAESHRSVVDFRECAHGIQLVLAMLQGRRENDVHSLVRHARHRSLPLPGEVGDELDIGVTEQVDELRAQAVSHGLQTIQASSN